MKIKIALLLCFASVTALAVLKTNLVNTGTSANSGNGDPVRTAFIKVNTNVADLDLRLDQSVEKNTWRKTNDIFMADAGAALLPVPPTIYRSWVDWVEASNTTLNETNFMERVRWYATNGMRAAGMDFVMIEEGWQGTQNPDGSWATTSSRFPSGMPWLANEIRKLGFRPGIYSSLRANAPSTSCMGSLGTDYSSLKVQMKQFAAWGFDYVFFDACNGWEAWATPPDGYRPAAGGNYHELYAERIRLVAEAIAECGRPMVFWVTFPFDFSTLNILTPNLGENTRPNVFVNGGPWSSDFATGTFSNQVRDADFNFDYITSHTRPGHFAYGRVINNGLNDAAWDFQHAIQTMTRQQISFQTFGSYPGMGGQLLRLTNLLAAAIHKDPFFSKPYRAQSNATAQVLVRQFGPSPALTNVVLLINSDTAAKTFSITNSALGQRMDKVVSYSSVYYQSNVTASVGGIASITVPASNSLYLVATVKGLRHQEVTFGIDEVQVTGTGVAKQTLLAQGPDPFFNINGLSQSAGNQNVNIVLPVPVWANNLRIGYNVTAAQTNVCWTNYFMLLAYNATGRVGWNLDTHAGITNPIVVATNGYLSRVNWGVRLASEPTYPGPTALTKSLFFSLSAGTNTGARYIIGNIEAEFWE